MKGITSFSMCLLTIGLINGASGTTSFELNNTVMSPDTPLKISLTDTIGKKSNKIFTVNGEEKGYWSIKTIQYGSMQSSTPYAASPGVSGLTASPAMNETTKDHYTLFLLGAGTNGQANKPVLQFEIIDKGQASSPGQAVRVFGQTVYLPPVSSIQPTNIKGFDAKGYFVDEKGNKKEEELNFSSKDGSSSVNISNFSLFSSS